MYFCLRWTTPSLCFLNCSHSSTAHPSMVGETLSRPFQSCKIILGLCCWAVSSSTVKTRRQHRRHMPGVLFCQQVREQGESSSGLPLSWLSVSAHLDLSAWLRNKRSVEGPSMAATANCCLFKLSLLKLPCKRQLKMLNFQAGPPNKGDWSTSSTISSPTWLLLMLRVKLNSLDQMCFITRSSTC